MPTPATLKSHIRKKYCPTDGARIAYLRYNPLLATRELLRFWTEIPDKHTEDCLRYLDDYTDAKNNQPKHYVDSPYAEPDEELLGTWRCVENRGAKQGEQAGVYQLLREGWATTLEDSEARLGGPQGVPTQSGYAFDQYWRNIDPWKVESLADGIKGTEFVTNPNVLGKEVSGSFVVSFFTSQATEGDGAGIITRRLTKVTTALTDAEARIGDVTGRAADGTFVFTRYYPNIDHRELDNLVADLRTTAMVDAPVIEDVAQPDLTFASSQVQGTVREDRTGVVSQVLTQITAVDAEGGLAALVAIASLEALDNSILELFNFKTGESDKHVFAVKYLSPTSRVYCLTTLTDLDMATGYLGVADQDALDASGWKYAGRAWSEEADGSATFRVAFEKAVWNEWATVARDDGGVFLRNSWDTRNKRQPGRNWEQRIKTWLNIRNADKTVATADLENPTSPDANYHLVDVQIKNNKNGSFDITQVTQKHFHKIQFLVQYLTRLGMVTYKRVLHGKQADLDTDVQSLTQGTNNTLSGSKEDNDGPDGPLYNYVLTKKPYSWSTDYDENYQVNFTFSAKHFGTYQHWTYTTYNWNKARNYLRSGNINVSTDGACPDGTYTKVGGYGGMRTGIQHLSSGQFIVRVVGGKD